MALRSANNRVAARFYNVWGSPTTTWCRVLEALDSEQWWQRARGATRLKIERRARNEALCNKLSALKFNRDASGVTWGVTRGLRVLVQAAALLATGSFGAPYQGLASLVAL